MPACKVARRRFTTLARSIVGPADLGQGGATVWDRFAALPRAMTPGNVLKLKVDDMRAAGLSARKVEYLVDLACTLTAGKLHVGRLGGHGRRGHHCRAGGHPWHWPLDGRDVPDLPSDAPQCAAAGRCGPDQRHQPELFFSGEPVSRSDAREVAEAWAPGAAWRLGIFGARSTRCPWPIEASFNSHEPVATQASHQRPEGATQGETRWQKTFLDFEQPIAELESKIEELRYVQTESAVDISEEIDQLSKKSQQLTKDIYSDLTPWQITKIARHPERPYTLDYVNDIFTDFVELHGDRHFADDLSIVGGLARFNGTPAW
jgi:hypothetical protein